MLKFADMAKDTNFSSHPPPPTVFFFITGKGIVLEVHYDVEILGVIFVLILVFGGLHIQAVPL